MTRDQWAIFVEGGDDQTFVESLVEHLDLDLSGFEVKQIGGGVNRLPSAENNIQRRYDAGRKIAMILDADQDIAMRRQEVTKQIKDLSPPLSEEHVFLLPDNCRAGNLETLLEELAVSTHWAIFNCLDVYGTCLLQASESYLPPGGKGRVYAYCEALRVEPRDTKREYLNAGWWDLSAPVVEPLSPFLRSLST